MKNLRNVSERSSTEKQENMRLYSVNLKTYKTNCVKNTYGYTQICMSFLNLKL